MMVFVHMMLAMSITMAMVALVLGSSWTADVWTRRDFWRRAALLPLWIIAGAAWPVTLLAVGGYGFVRWYRRLS